MAPHDRPRRPAPASEPDWLTLGQAATYLGVAQSTIRKWSDAGRVPAFTTPGGHRRFRRRDLDAFVELSGPGGRPSGPVVLVVDDDPAVRALVRAGLEPAGYAVREAATAREGLAAIADRPPDLVLLDVLMPEMDGWEMLRQVQERYGSVPVIVFSGTVEAGAERVHGAHAFVGKPFDPRELVERARQLLPL